MNQEQETAVRSALYDLIGAWQDWVQRGSGDSCHDWSAHTLTIWELAKAFGLEDELPGELR